MKYRNAFSGIFNYALSEIIISKNILNVHWWTNEMDNLEFAWN